MDAKQVFAAVGEPTRFRVLTLLAAGPRTVGEIADELGALQPQTTKHIQALETAGVVRVQRIGRRRLASLNRDALRELASWLDTLAVETEDDRALADYAAGVAHAETRTASGGPATVDLAFERTIAASRDAVWRAWTDPAVAAHWWAPRHFTVVRCAVEPEPGARVELVLREGDGAEYSSAGTVREVQAGRRLAFDLSPIDAEGEVIFPVEVEVVLYGDDSTRLALTVHASAPDRTMAAMLAGLEPGWSQQLDRLATLFTVEPS
ncbi:metalloregulator ArsR/SmtB family transcription factor [Leifsonia sp. NPDC056824]|uniref:metalloregulator ArsR/SmtB family transcription factor n=1 Tax=Leifsonia sp. NPDC056824 TaxID=3345953 RepID=UPI0036983AEE